MAKRSLETLTDVLVLIVSPILVMILVGSLAFFLIQCCYQGQFYGRLNFATGLFVMSAVLISRISIEEGREYASAFAMPLGIVTILSIMQYTDLGPLFAVGLVLFIWWSTDKLTWDCTVIEESQDASGEGLLQTIGLDEAAEEDPDATTDSVQTDSTSLWKKWADRRRRHHTPGVWVIYFGLAAIPLFGLGQSMLPSNAKGAGFLLLCTYVATALALLMITSFLQMRRYLIQRRLPLSEKMAATWLGTGGAIIIVLMIVCLLLPRPNTGYSMVDALTQSIQKASSRDRDTSDWAFGQEGVKDEEEEGQGEGDEEAKADSERGRQASQKSERGNVQGDQGDAEGHKEEQRRQGRQEKGNQSNAKQGNGGNRGDRSQRGEQSEQSNQKDQSSKSRNRSEEQNDRRSNSKSEQSERQQNGKQPSDEDTGESDNRRSGSSKPAIKPPSLPNPIKNLSLPPIPKLLYFAVVAIGILLLLIFYGRQIVSAVTAFLRDFWALFFGGRKREPDEEVEEEVVVEQPRPFHAFKDPFASGMASRLSTQQLVAYTFEALQAWAFEQQCPRQADQTPLEFAGQISQQHVSVGPHARNLAVLYNQAAYAPSTLGQNAVEHVRALWKSLRGS